MHLRSGGRFIPAVVMMMLIFWFSSLPGDEVRRATDPLFRHAPSIQIVKRVQIPWLKVGHVVGYSGLGAALLYGFGANRRWGSGIALAVTLLYALSDELHQAFTPGRTAKWGDVLIDLAAAGLAILVFMIIRRARAARAGR